MCWLSQRWDRQVTIWSEHVGEGGGVGLIPACFHTVLDTSLHWLAFHAKAYEDGRGDIAEMGEQRVDRDHVGEHERRSAMDEHPELHCQVPWVDGPSVVLDAACDVSDDALEHAEAPRTGAVGRPEAAVWRCGIEPSFETGVAAYEVAAVMATHQLRLGLSVVVDAVGSLEIARRMWRDAASRAGATTRVIEVVCSDETTHRERLAGHIEGFPEPSWDGALARRDEWEPWKEPRLLIDSTARQEDNLAEALAYVSR